MNENGSKLRFSEFFSIIFVALPTPYTVPNMGYFFYLFRLHHIVMSSNTKSFPMNYFIAFNSQKVQKTLNFDPFLLIFALFAA